MTRLFTKQGFNEIETEINRLWMEERPMVLEEVYEAAQLGDRSENAAYIYGKQRLRMIDKRLRILKQKINDVKVIDTDALPQQSIVQFGAFVSIEDEEGNQKSFRLVDKEEIDPDRNRVSVQSPIGKALIGKEDGDSFVLVLPKKSVEYEIISVYYGPDVGDT
jgi:transcription elongation factor GreB